jgi:phosphoenolpyruvate-protein kinase (PTS system EI component)
MYLPLEEEEEEEKRKVLSHLNSVQVVVRKLDLF